MALDEQIKTWLVLLTLNLMVLSSIMMEIMAKDLNISQIIEINEVSKKNGKTSPRRGME